MFLAGSSTRIIHALAHQETATIPPKRTLGNLRTGFLRQR